jgi:hypothetical protein
MKTICALIAAGLALQACNSQPGTPTVSSNINEYSTLSEYIGAASTGEDDWYTAAVSAPANNLNWIENGVEFYIDPGHTAAVPPARKPTSYEEDYAMWTTLPTAEYWIDTTSDDHTAAVSQAIKPIDGAEFEGTSRDDAYTPWSALPTGPLLDDYVINWSMDTDDHDAAVTSPANKAAEDKSVTTEPALYFDDDGFGSTLPARIDQYAIQATDGW